MPIAAIVTDIEGTTTPISFVADVLFPYARQHLAAFIASNADDPAVAALIEDTRLLAGLPNDDVGQVTRVLLQWIAEDRKATPLKELQGLIWLQGYAAGDFKGMLYPDVPKALATWRDAGLALYVYSSGSVAAQRLLFGNSDAGDLTPLFSGFFDTHIGAKVESRSYHHLCAEIGTAPDAILFLSDSERELDAARTAGLQTICLARDGAVESRHPVHESFATIALDI